MGIFDSLLAKLTGKAVSSPEPSLPLQGGRITLSITGPAVPNVHVSATEVAERVKKYDYILTTDPPPLKNSDKWWEEKIQKRQVRNNSESAYAWAQPFLPLEIVKLAQLRSDPEGGVLYNANAIAKGLRALIRERRKLKQSHEDLLRALYGSCVMADFAASLEFEGMQSHAMTKYVDIRELQAVRCDYATMGYQCSKSLSKTDVKWLVESFGEPTEHQSFSAVYPNVVRNAIGRYCWQELHRKNEAVRALGLPEQTMQEWLNELVKLSIRYQREGQERFAERRAKTTALATSVDAAWAATRGRFVVADLETIGLNAESDEVLEFAAVLVDPSGRVASEFSTLVRVMRPVPDFITKLTGITQTDVESEGRPIGDAMAAFLAFIGPYPVFFHNAPFDESFLNKAAAHTKQKFSNVIHDTMPMARMTWPSLGTYKLSVLAEHVGAPSPSHRALADAKATLAVLLAARMKAPPGGHTR